MANEFERLTEDVVLIDGRYYRRMTDDECAKFILSPETGEAQATSAGKVEPKGESKKKT